MEIISKNPTDYEIVARWIHEECGSPISEIEWLLKQAFTSKGFYGEYDSVIETFKERKQNETINTKNKRTSKRPSNKNAKYNK